MTDFRSTLRTLLFSSVALTFGACVPASVEEIAGSDSYVLVWLYDEDMKDEDFLAVVDVDPKSATYTKIVKTYPSGLRGVWAHHSNYTYPAHGRLFANGYYSGHTVVFDVSDPMNVSIVGQFNIQSDPFYKNPHSFAALENGNTLGAFQDSWDGKDGALIEMDGTGQMVRFASAADEHAGEVIHPYSLDVNEAMSQVITGNGDIMRGGPSNHVIQLWSLDTLERLHTVKLEHGPRGIEAQDPVEPRYINGGASAMVVTDRCGLYHLDGIYGEAPSSTLVYDFGEPTCGVPAVIGRYWLQTVTEQHTIVVLDVSDPENPIEVSRVTFLDPEGLPHWISPSPDGTRVLLSSVFGFLEGRLILMNFDPETGELTLDESFHDEGSDLIGVDFAGRTIWPHGETDGAISHGAVFWGRKTD